MITRTQLLEHLHRVRTVQVLISIFVSTPLILLAGYYIYLLLLAAPTDKRASSIVLGGFAWASVFGFLLALAAFVWVFRQRDSLQRMYRLRHRMAKSCEHCGYSLRRIYANQRCPECGHPVPRSEQAQPAHGVR